MTTENRTFDRAAGVTFKVNQEARTIKGLAVPFGVVGDNGFGKYRFAKGTLDWSKVKYLTHHDWSQAVGNVDFEETDEGLLMTAKIARGSRGDEVLSLTEDGVYDGLSIGLSYDARFEEDADGVFDCLAGTVLEVSGTPIPAFKEAQVRSVAASAAQNKESTMPEKTTEEAAAVFSKEDGDKLMSQVQTLTEQMTELQSIKLPVGPGGTQLEVREEPIYRFEGSIPAPSGFDFATDLLAAAKDNDKAALERLKKYTAERVGHRFADQPTTTADTAALNPNQYRPDLFLGQAPVPASPLFDFFLKGSLSNVTPFYWSKLDRTNTDVGVADHTEGTDPETRDVVTATVTPVTPVPVSGRVHITREVGDQGGNPAVSALIRNEFDRSYSIACETKTAALVLASAAAELGAAITAGATDGGVVGAIVEDGLIGLQFRDDGFRFEKIFGHVDLYKLLAKAVKGADNLDKLYPIINPQNATGQAASKWAYLDIGGYRMQPAAKLGATDTNKKSYVADPFAVHVWASGLHQLDKLQETVEGWDIGVFGYFAGVVYDSTGLLKITYDPTA